MHKFKQNIKQKILGTIELLPFGRDMYLVLAKNRLSISYRGIFESYEQAKAAVPKRKASNYDVVNANKAANIEQEIKGLKNWFNDSDYPLLFWLSKLLRENDTVLELGGSVGHSFYTFQNFMCYPNGLKWTIAELKQAVKLGRKIAEDCNENRLLFFDSNLISSLEPSDIFLTAGTLQYMDSTLPEILQRLKKLPRHVLVHNLPSHCKQSFWTLQNLSLCEVPYKIYSVTELKTTMQEVGFELVASWVKHRNIEIPYHRSLKIEGYLGYYFKYQSR